MIATYKECLELVLKFKLDVKLKEPPRSYLVTVTDSAWPEAIGAFKMSSNDVDDVLLKVVKFAVSAEAVGAQSSKLHEQLERIDDLENYISGDRVKGRYISYQIEVPSGKRKPALEWRTCQDTLMLHVMKDVPYYDETHAATLQENLKRIRSAAEALQALAGAQRKEADAVALLNEL